MKFTQITSHAGYLHAIDSHGRLWWQDQNGVWALDDMPQDEPVTTPSDDPPQPVASSIERGDDIPW